jgi:hypothetical protein
VGFLLGLRFGEFDVQKSCNGTPSCNYLYLERWNCDCTHTIFKTFAQPVTMIFAKFVYLLEGIIQLHLVYNFILPIVWRKSERQGIKRGV